MDADRLKTLRAIANSSGYLLQLAVEQAVIDANIPEWSVAAREHPYAAESGGASGFVDLVLEKGIARLVIECKRPQEATWVFFAERDRPKFSRRARVLWGEHSPGEVDIRGWTDIAVFPESPECDFCVMHGEGRERRAVLERMASELVRSCECLLEEEIAFYRGRDYAQHLIYVPAVVTTARLAVCRVNPGEVSL